MKMSVLAFWIVVPCEPLVGTAVLGNVGIDAVSQRGPPLSSES